jgi:peptidyl-prolyl cis-trans isomerase C
MYSKEFVVNPVLFIFSLLFLSLTVQASEPDSDSEILAKRGDGIVTQMMFSARADKIPAEARLGALRDGGRLQDVINTLLLRAQLAADARKAGFQNEKMVKARMQLAADTELAEAWMQNYVDDQPDGDYEQLAFEYYQTHPDEMLTPEKIDVSHILVSTKERTQEEALELATSLSQQLEKDPLIFDDLVTEYSDDPSAASNAGKFHDVKRGDMVSEFEKMAFSLKEGEISAPVKTKFGYHIIRLDARMAPEKISFELVKQRLMDDERKQHGDRIKQDYLGRLTSLDVEMSEQQLGELIDRLFGEDFIDPYTAGKK